MALASIIVLRRAAYSSLLPRRSLLAATSAARSAVDRSLVVPVSRLISTSTYSDLVRMLDEEIDCAEKRRQSSNTCVPPGFPFRIENTKSKRVVILSRMYEDEIIKAEVKYGCVTNFINMVVTISKEWSNSEQLFKVMASPPSIYIQNLFVKKDLWGRIDDRAPCHRSWLNKWEKKSWAKYLEMRGINLTTISYLLKFRDPNNFNMEHKDWLYNLKKFAARSAAAADVDSSLVVPLSRRFSTSSDSDLVHKLDVEIERTDKKLAPETRVPPEIPFRIESTESEHIVILSRRYGDEIIKAEVDMKEKEGKEKKWIKMVVTISKESGNNELMFIIRAFEDRIAIRILFVKHDLWGNIQPSMNFGDLDEKLQEGFHKYLEKRGINLKTTNFLREKKIAPADKKSLEYRDWLCDLKEFVPARSAALLAVDRSLVVPLSRRFSTSSDVASQPTNEDDLVHMLDGEIERVHNKNLNTCVPPGFPFRVEISESGQTMILSRRYEDEIIKGEVDVIKSQEYEFPMDVTISKESGNMELLFHTYAHAGHFAIWGLYVKKDLWGRVGDYDRDHFDEDGYGLREDFEEYLEMRGFNDTTFKFLLEKLDNVKDKNWLCELKKFLA